MFKQGLEINDWTGYDYDQTTGKTHKTTERIAQIPLEYFTVIRVFSAVVSGVSVSVSDRQHMLRHAVYSSAFAQQFTTLKSRMANLWTIVPCNTIWVLLIKCRCGSFQCEFMVH